MVTRGPADQYDDACWNALGTRGSGNSAERIRNSDFLSSKTKEQLKQDSEIQEALSKAIKLRIERGYLDSAERIRNSNFLSDETKEQLKQNPKIQQALFEAIKSEIKRGNLDSAETIGNSDFLSNETKKQLKQDSEIQEALFKAVESRIERGYFDGVKTIGNSNFLSDETKEQLKQNPEIQWALSKAIKSRIERGYFDGVKTIRNSDFLSDETIAKFKTSEFLLDIVKHNVENGNIRNIARIIADKNFHLNRESVKKLYLPEVAKLFPQKISFEDLLNIYDFDENGRAKLKKEYEQAVKIFSRNMEGRVRSGLAREIMEKRAKLRKMKEENGASSSVEMVSLKNDLENILREYYAEQGALWFDFKNNPDRLVSEQSRNKNIFFLHQMPILPGDRSYSRLGSNVPFDVLANLNVALEPTLSTSFKEFNLGGGYRIANQKDGAGGLLFGNGKIALADAGDSYTISDGLDAKFRHRFGDGVSVDDNIEQRMNDILQKERVKNRWGHNEIIIHRPQVCGVFLYADEFETAIDSERINIAQKAANEIGVPLFRINEDGRIRKMGENYDLKLEEVLANTLNLSKEEKEKIVQEKLINSGQFTRDYIESFKKRKNQFERESDRRIRELEEVVSDEEYSPEKLIYALKNNFEEQYATKDMTWEGYSLEEHTKMVLNQFEKYFKDFDSPLVSKSNLRLFLALHDIGKPEAIKLGNKALQHEKTAPIINNVFDVLKLPKKEKDILVAISKDDYIGKYLRDKISLEKVADSVKNIAEKQGVSEKDLLYLMEVYHKSDAGSYTENAGGKRSLDKYFEFDERNGKMKYSDKYQAKMDELRTVLGIGN